ncbi:MAG: hypothetical protein SF052_16100 [Bacteroidia bacterium]|nr:hypothetical protein [Bacteroidia bacterium]
MNQKVCSLKRIKFLQTWESEYIDGEETYLHEVLIEGYYRPCMDSADIVRLSLSYLDTVSHDLPLFAIRFYSSDENFEYGEMSPDPFWIEDDLLVQTMISRNGTVDKFLFFDKNFQSLYNGKNFSEGKRMLLKQ